MITLYNSKEECCGCGACSSVCPKSAITMQEDEYGFIYPMVDTRLRNKIFRKYKASGYAGVEAIFERDQRNQKFIWGMYDRICGMFCRKTR